jgi:hypothetical protein
MPVVAIEIRLLLTEITTLVGYWPLIIAEGGQATKAKATEDHRSWK